MREFMEIALSDRVKPIYQRIVQEMNVEGHPEFLKRPIKILDLGGGNGVIGNVIKSQCETSFGPLSPAEFSLLVDYVNVDGDSDALKQSPGRTIYADLANTYQKIPQEIGQFDFVLSINPSAAIPRVGAGTLADPRMPDHIRTQLMENGVYVECSFTRIILLHTALLLQKNGKYIFSGFAKHNAIKGILTYSKMNNLGLEVERNTTVDVDEETRNLFIAVDTGCEPSNPDFEKIRAQYRMFTLLSMSMQTPPNTQRITALLDKEVHNYDGWLDFRIHQDRFGSW